MLSRSERQTETMVTGSQQILIAEGTFLRQKRVGYVARVKVEIRTPVATPAIAVELEGELWARPTPEWEGAARYGVDYALGQLKRTDCLVRITQILGTIADTNATIVAAAAVDAVWKALKVEPPAALRSRIEEVTLESWTAKDAKHKEFGNT